MHALPVAALGRESVPLRIADAAHPDPLRLLAAARDAAFRPSEGDLYPGVRAPAPEEWGSWLIAALGVWSELAMAELLRADFAIACHDPAGLAPLQRIPHFDTTDPAIFAVIHYLCEAPHLGTAFYRHRATGFERVTPERAPLWRQALVADASRHGLPDGRYHHGDSASFEQIGMAPLQFNRLAVYPANCLHCGDIGETWSRGDRLTITALIRLPLDAC